MKKPIWSFRLTGRTLLTALTILLLVVGGLLVKNGNSTKLSSFIPVVSAMSGNMGSDLRERVELLAKQLNTPPIDAKNDPVWKAIPGLNGVEIDVDATVKKSEANPGNRISLVAKQIPPKVSLDDLGALPIYRGNGEKKQMALMINVAWGTEYIPEILQILQQNHVKCTFFLDGSWTNKNPAVAKEILDAGQELGNHAYSHPDLSKYGADATLREISRTNQVIKQATGVTPTLFAPPSGAFTGTTVNVAHGQGMRTILWTIDTLDWRRPPASTIYNRVFSKATNGGLVLMHPTAPTRDALRTLIPDLQKKGYELVTVSQLLDTTRPLPTNP